MSSNGNSDGAATSPTPDAPEPATALPRGLQSSATQDPQHDTNSQPPEFLDAHSRHRLGWALAIAGGLVVLLLVATYGAYFLRFGGLPSGDQGIWGQFGDFVGGTLNSLLGLLTLLALVFTVVLQTRQLELSRDELRATRSELERSATAQREAADAMKGQLEQARLTAMAQQQAARALNLAATYQRDIVKLTMEQGEQAKRSANAQWRAAQIAGLSEGIRLAQHHLANMPPNMPIPNPHLVVEAEHIEMLRLRALENYWNLFETVIDGTRSEGEQALD